MNMKIYSTATPSALTLWWERPEDVQGKPVYTVLLDGKTVWNGDRTHCTLGDLSSETLFDIQVYLNDCLLGQTQARTARPRRRMDVTASGCVGDGVTLNTRALQRAIDACGEEEELYFPAGVYLTGALRLHSGVSLYLEEGAVLQGTENSEDYLPKIKSRFEGTEMLCYQSLLNLGEMDHAAGPNCRNVLIHGKGTICGGGQALALNIIQAEKERLKEYLASLGSAIKEYENDRTIPGRARGRLINLSNCENVRISGLTLQNGASWNVHMLYSREILTDHCVFRSEDVWNGDGWDPDSSENCTLFGCEFHTGDDSVAIKSGKNPEGNLINRPTKHIRIFDCRSEYGLGIAIGSEMSGGVEDVKIWDCDLEHSLYGVQIKGTKKRGGYVKSVTVENCILPRFLICAVPYNDDGVGAAEPPVFSDCSCRDVQFTGWARNYWEKELHAMPIVDLSGFPGYPAKNITFHRCIAPENAEIRLSCSQNVQINIQKAEKK